MNEKPFIALTFSREKPVDDDIERTMRRGFVATARLVLIVAFIPSVIVVWSLIQPERNDLRQVSDVCAIIIKFLHGAFVWMVSLFPMREEL